MQNRTKKYCTMCHDDDCNQTIVKMLLRRCRLLNTNTRLGHIQRHPGGQRSRIATAARVITSYRSAAFVTCHGTVQPRALWMNPIVHSGSSQLRGPESVSCRALDVAVPSRVSVAPWRRSNMPASRLFDGQTPFLTQCCQQ